MLNLVLTLTRGLLRLCFGFRAHGVESLQVRGPALLIPNHVSWLDIFALDVKRYDGRTEMPPGVTP